MLVQRGSYPRSFEGKYSTTTRPVLTQSLYANKALLYLLPILDLIGFDHTFLLITKRKLGYCLWRPGRPKKGSRCKLLETFACLGMHSDTRFQPERIRLGSREHIPNSNPFFTSNILSNLGSSTLPCVKHNQYASVFGKGFTLKSWRITLTAFILQCILYGVRYQGRDGDEITPWRKQHVVVR